MSKGADTKSGQTSDVPYGTEQQRSHAPLVILSIVYGLWFLFLLWTALFKSGGR